MIPNIKNNDNFIPYIPKWYKINVDTIETLEDVKEIIRCMDIQFNEYSELSKLPDRFKIELNNNKNNS